MTQWQRIDGTLLAADVAAQRDALVEYFTRHDIPVVLEFQAAAPWFVGLRLWANDDGRVAAAGGDALVAGLEVEELAEDIAERFGVDVLLADVSVEREDEQAESGEHAGHDHDHDEACDLGPRVVTLLPGAEATDLPGLARALGETLRIAPSPVGPLVLTEPGAGFPGVDGVGVELRIVQLIVDGADRSLFVHAGDDAPVTFAWGTELVALPGAAAPGAELREYAELLASDDDVVATLLRAAPAEAGAVRAALGSLPADGPRALLAALGVGAEVAEFLEGGRAAADVPGSHTVEPARPVEVLRSSLGAAADDVSELRLVELADEFQRRQPVVSRTLSVAQALAGAALLARSARRDGPWRAAALTTGVFLVVDGLGELALYEWLRTRRTR